MERGRVLERGGFKWLNIVENAVGNKVWLDSESTNGTFIKITIFKLERLKKGLGSCKREVQQSQALEVLTRSVNPCVCV